MFTLLFGTYLVVALIVTAALFFKGVLKVILLPDRIYKRFTDGDHLIRKRAKTEIIALAVGAILGLIISYFVRNHFLWS